VAFITDVAGVYDIPPSNPTAKLLHEIIVTATTDISTTKLDASEAPVVQQTHEHDVTGGMLSKINSALSIAKTGVVVYIVNVHVPNLGDIVKRGSKPDVGTTIYCKTV